MTYRVWFTHHQKKDGETVVVLKSKYKNTIASATNLVYKVHASLSHNLKRFERQVGEDEWVDYDMPWMNTHAEIRARITELDEFHRVFYDDSHQG